MPSSLPPVIVSLVGQPQFPGHALLLSMVSDLDQAGRSAEQWLVATEESVAVVASEDTEQDLPARCLASYALRDLQGCRVQTQVGSGYLQVRHNDVWIDVLRFSNRLASRFREAAERLERLRCDHEFRIDADGDTQPKCQSCGHVLSGEDATCKNCQPSADTFRRVLRLLRPHGKTVFAILVLSIIAVAIELIPPWLQKILVDRVLSHGSEQIDLPPLLSTLAIIVGSLALVRVTVAIVSVIKSRLSSEIGTHLTADLRTRMVDKLERLSVSFHDRHQVGLLMSRVAYDTEAMHTFMHNLSGGFLLQIMQLLAIGGMLFALNPKLAFITLFPTPLVLLASWFFCKCLYLRNHRYWDAVGRQAAALTSVLSGIRVVKSFTQESREHARFSAASERLRASRISVDLANATFSSIVGVLFGLGGLVVWYVGGRDVLQNEMTLGSLMAFLAYLSMFYAPLTTVSEGASWMSNFLSASHRIFNLLDTPVTIDDPPAPRAVDQLQGHIRFDNVTFAYDDQNPVLEHFCLEVHPGEAIGIVGRSGSGKSTLACLVSRLYDVQSGSITIDGIDVREMSGLALRRRVGMVLQQPYLFQGTVGDNIAYGDPGAEPERILSSARAGGAHEFILRMPFGYDTMLGECGTGLSGGERQRISIARAILYNPTILILDEATSSVDTESERLIQHAIERFSKGRTTLAIAHRLSTLEHADRLIVMDQGRLIEQGTHRELLEADGAYARLVRMQFGRSMGKLIGNHDQSEPSSTENNQKDYDDTLDLNADIPWLDPQEAVFHLGTHNVLILQTHGKQYGAIYTVRAFPASSSEEYLSIRYADDAGRDREIGLMRNLNDWSEETRHLIRRSLNRRYLLRIVNSLIATRQENGLVSCVAQTDDGEVQFMVHNNPHRVTHFGSNGWLLTDVDDNHFLIPNLDTLPFLHRQLFRNNFVDV
ncbi:DUF1854 domain-containing protein [bacterium]|nr:DUF1854 domain-containing protein [bacterium]